MLDGLTLNGVRNGRKFTTKVDFNAGGVDFYEGGNSDDPTFREAKLWIDAVINDKDPFVLPEQAFTVTQILEGIYTSAKTGTVYNF